MMDEKELTLRAATKKFLRSGIDRVMISENEAVPPGKARKQYNIESSIIFMRKDGWTLGAPEKFIMAAYKTWPDEWIFFIERPNTYFQPIHEYKI